MTLPQLPIQLDDPSLFKTDSYIDGKWVQATDNSTFPVDNPANGLTIAQVANLGPEQAQAAIDSADKAFKSWRTRTGKERAGILRKWFDLIIANTEDLAKLMTLEQGKPLAEARGEIGYGGSFVEWFAEQAKRRSEEHTSELQSLMRISYAVFCLNKKKR